MLQMLQHNWQYIIQEGKDYGYELKLYCDGILYKSQSGYGSKGVAQYDARRILVEAEFGIDITPEE